MNQIKSFGVEAQKFNNEHYNMFQGQSYKQRFSLTMPEYSAVRQNFPSNNQLGASQISWLQKFSFENEKQEPETCFSKKDKHSNYPNRHEINEMKFSFNPQEDAVFRQKGKEILANESHQKPLVQSILRKGRYFQQIQVKMPSKLQVSGMTPQKQKKYNYIKNERQFCQIDSFSKQSNIKKIQLSRSKQQYRNPIDKMFSKLKIQQKQNGQIYSISNTLRNRPVKTTCQIFPATSTQTTIKKPIQLGEIGQYSIDSHYLDVFYEKLNKNKSFSLSNQNCSTEQIRDELKFCFGNIFSQILFHKREFNKQQFIVSCLETLKYIRSEIPIKLLIDLDPLWQKEVKTHSVAQRQLNSTNEEKNLCEKCRKSTKIQQNTVNNIARSSSLRHVDPPKQNEADYSSYKNYVNQTRHNKHSSVDIKQKYNTNQRLVNIGKEELTMRSTVNQKYNEAAPLSVCQITGNFKTYQNELEEQSKYFKLIDGKDTEPPGKKKIRNISQEILREHRRNLKDLTKLNCRIQDYFQNKIGQNNDVERMMLKRLVENEVLSNII